MGMYMYITQWERERMKSVYLDEELNNEFQEALKYDDSLLIGSREVLTKRFLRPTKVETRYQIYHDCDPKGSPYQARYQISGSGSKEIVIAYLHGIINGALAIQKG